MRSRFRQGIPSIDPQNVLCSLQKPEKALANRRRHGHMPAAIAFPPMAHNSQPKPHIALYAGSFDPPTLGHLDVIERARRLFDVIVVGIGENPNKQHMLEPALRLALMQEVVAGLLANNPNGAPVRVEIYGGLTVDFARSIGAVALLRGIRNVTDLASECQLAIANRQVADIESAFVITDERYGFTSSSLIRQIVDLGGDVDKLDGIVPTCVLEHLRNARDSGAN